MARFPEMRVTRDGHFVKKVEWDPSEHGEAIFDLTGMKVMKVETEITADGSAPSVKVTFAARLVEVEET